MNVPLRVPTQMTVAEFLTWNPGEDGRTWQLVDGEPQAMAPASLTHGLLQNELGAIIRNHLQQQSSPCVVAANPGIIPRLRASHNMRVPDLAVTCSERSLDEAALTDPVLVVEILPPSNQAETWANVWAYTTIPSVREILVLRSVTIGAEILRRLPDEDWPAEPERLEEGDLVLESIGLRVPLAEIYETTRLRLKPEAASAP